MSKHWILQVMPITPEERMQADWDYMESKFWHGLPYLGKATEEEIESLVLTMRRNSTPLIQTK